MERALINLSSAQVEYSEDQQAMLKVSDQENVHYISLTRSRTKQVADVIACQKELPLRFCLVIAGKRKSWVH